MVMIVEGRNSNLVHHVMIVEGRNSIVGQLVVIAEGRNSITGQLERNRECIAARSQASLA
jgi:hypothetical protein